MRRIDGLRCVHDQPKSAPTLRQQRGASLGTQLWQPRGAARAAGGLLYPASRRMIVVQEPTNGEFSGQLARAPADKQREGTEHASFG